MSAFVSYGSCGLVQPLAFGLVVEERHEDFAHVGVIEVEPLAFLGCKQVEVHGLKVVGAEGEVVEAEELSEGCFGPLGGKE